MRFVQADREAKSRLNSDSIVISEFCLESDKFLVKEKEKYEKFLSVFGIAETRRTMSSGNIPTNELIMTSSGVGSRRGVGHSSNSMSVEKTSGSGYASNQPLRKLR
jgi:hypothetical protein